MIDREVCPEEAAQIRAWLQQEGIVGVYRLQEVGGALEFVKDGKVVDVGLVVRDLRGVYANVLLLRGEILRG